MSRIALLLKSHRPDFAYASRLIESFSRFNEENLQLYCVVPSVDVPVFSAFSSSAVTVVSQEDIAGGHLVKNGMHGLSAGYINQEIVKLAFWETGLADNYFCVDSDAVFIRGIHTRDFMRDDETPFSVLVQDKELAVQPRYFAEHWRSRELSLRQIMDVIGLEDPIIRTCHGHQIFSSQVLSSLVADFFNERGWTYADALQVSPYEFSWYNMWLQKSEVIPIHPIEPLVKVFHNEEQHLASLLLGETLEDFARSYIAVVINSNYSRAMGLVSFSDSKTASLAPYLSYGELSALLAAKARNSWDRGWSKGKSVR